MRQSTSCLFVYGLVDAGAWEDGGAALRAGLAATPGVDPPGPPRLLTLGRLGVLLSDVPLADFSGPQFAANLESLEWLEPRVRAHAAVIALAFAHQSVLPLRFATLYASVDGLAAALAPRRQTLLQALAATRGQEEWSVRFCANPEALLAQLAAEQVARTAQQGGQGTQYLLRRRLALQGRQELEARLLARAGVGDAALARMARQSSEARTEVTGLPGGQRSLFSQVYLIDQRQREQFLAELERVSSLLLPDGITLLHSGPWPPARSEALVWSTAGQP